MNIIEKNMNVMYGNYKLSVKEYNYRLEQIIKDLEKEKEPIFNNNVISKYINTCRYCGIDIIKVHNKYFVRSLPFGMEILNKEFDGVSKYIELSKTYRSSKEIIDYSNKILNLNHVSFRGLPHSEPIVLFLRMERDR